MKLRAYAKVNLILKVLGKKENGYHLLQMLNGKIDIYDEIEITKNSFQYDTLKYKNSTLDETKDDLVLKCMNKIKQRYNIKDNFNVVITKNIPIGAGLGGGSSDAACVVRYLLNLYNIEYNKEEIINMMVEYGADIPYCLENSLSIVEGIGEKIININNLEISDFILINPNIYISTKEVFKKTSNYSLPYLKNELIEKVEKEGYFAFSNDLEDAAYLICDELKSFKENLNTVGYSVMSGSGSTFLVFSENINAAYEKLKTMYPSFLIKKVKIIKE